MFCGQWCRCLWKRCTFCVRNMSAIRKCLTIFCVMDVIVMLWYLYLIGESREQMSNCCSVSNNYPRPSIHSNSLNTNYSTCSDLDYFQDTTPFDIHFLNAAHHNWNKFSSIFTSYNMQISVADNGGCVYNSNIVINCLSDTVMPCVEHVELIMFIKKHIDS